MSEKIGIPRSLLYYYYYPAWDEFFQQLGCEVILSPKTNKKILDDGVRLAVDDLCLPFKVYFGHVKWLLDRVDYLFIPRLIGFGKKNRFCPKFMGLPDMLKSVFVDKKIPRIIEPVIETKGSLLPFHNIAHNLGEELGFNFFQIEKAYWKALEKQKKFDELKKNKNTPREAIQILTDTFKQNTNKNKGNTAGEDIDRRIKEKEDINKKNRDDTSKKYFERRQVLQKNKTNKGLTVVLLGHSYIINDKYMSMGLFDHLDEMGVQYITTEMLEEDIIERAALTEGKPSFWYFNRHILGTAYYFLNNQNIRNSIDGFIQVTAFGCGPDSLISQLIDLKGKSEEDISILNINLDEHSGQAGLKTRLEAFIDLLERRKGA